MENKDDKKILHKISGRQNKSLIQLPVSFQQTFLNPQHNQEIVSAPIFAIRIVFKLINDVKLLQFQADNTHQLKLFEANFLSENNGYVSFSYPIRLIDSNRDYNRLQEALFFLEKLQKKWYNYKNSNGEKFKALGGIISLPEITKGNIHFLVSAYWLEKLANVSRYNTAHLKIAWQLSNTKQVLFYTWLLEVPESGTRIKFETLQTKFHLNYSSKKDLIKFFLKRVKAQLDKHSNISFNFKTIGSHVSITPYYCSEKSSLVKKNTKIQQNYRLKYWSKRHRLDKNQLDTLKKVLDHDPASLQIFQAAYKEFVRNCRTNKKIASSFTGQDFLLKWQNQINITWRETASGRYIPNGGPRVFNEL